ncbi:hypothetical protein D3C85_991740 [compost metagenome]
MNAHLQGLGWGYHLCSSMDQKHLRKGWYPMGAGGLHGGYSLTVAGFRLSAFVLRKHLGIFFCNGCFLRWQLTHHWYSLPGVCLNAHLRPLNLSGNQNP